MGLKTTTAGWFPKPHRLRLARWRHAEGEIDGAALRQVEREVTAEAIELQRAIGLDALVDPQMARGDLVGALGERIDGFEDGGPVRCWGNRYYRRPRIVGELRLDGPPDVDAWRTAHDAAGGPVRAILTGPYTAMDWSFDEHYGSRGAAASALAELAADEADALVGAGATTIEIDEPAAGVRPDELPLVADGLERVIARVAGRAECWVRAGMADPGVELAPLGGLPGDVLMLPMANAGPTATDALAAGVGERTLVAGVIDVHDPRVESTDELRAAIECVLRHVPAERLWVAPDGGLQALEAGVAEAKLRALVEAAAGF